MRRTGLVIRRWATLGVVAAAVVTAALGGATGASAYETHTVEDGDTLQGLADLHGVSVEEVAAANGLDPWDDVYPGQDLVMPGEGNTASVPDDEDGGSGDATIIDGVPAYQQSRSLSCEYASVYMATSVFGARIPEDDYIWSTPQSDNPHFGFRGDIDGEWGITEDYGIYAEALVPTLEEHGYVGEVSYGADAGSLQAQLDAGHPTIVWVATRGDTGFYEEDADGNVFKLVPYEHVMVAYGYDEDGVYVADPGPANFQHLGWDWFLAAWSVMDGMALSVYPA